MNVLFSTIYTGIGGGESLTLNLMRAMDRARFGLHLLTPSDGAFPTAARTLGVQTHCIPFRGASTFFVPAVWGRFPITGKIAALLREAHIDAVMSDYHTLPFVIPAAEAAGIPVIWNAMGWWFPIHPWQRRFFARRIRRIIAISGAVKDRLLGTPPKLPPEHIDVFIPGVDTDQHQPGVVSGAPVREKLAIGLETPLVAMIARFQNVKGHEYFLEAARHVLEGVPEARFAVAGENVFAVSRDEAYKQSILSAVQNDALLRDRVSYLGFWPDAREVLAAADVMVCSSWFESLSMVALESMAMARPIVSTSVGGPAETVLDGVTGFLVPPRDARALAGRIVQLVRDPALRAKMGAAGRARALEHFSARRYAQTIEDVIEQAIHSPPGIGQQSSQANSQAKGA
ncbi:MAG: glycosyltransferase family 4 protein [Anaerolineae bacterium]|nr:glycosyltransferase family 4 protein [Anaerolineae bacterium]